VVDTAGNLVRIRCNACPIGHASDGHCPFVKRHFEKHQLLFHQGDDVDRVWFIRSGIVTLARDACPGDPPAVWTVRRPGRLVGVETIALPRYADTAYTATPAFLCTLSREGMNRWIRDAPDTVLKLVVQLAEDIVPPRRGTAVARLARWIVDGATHDLINAIPRNATAELLVMSPETLSRSLAELASRGILRTDRRRVLVQDIAALKSAACA
jgi:CRP-like cAMP-binding protein